MGGFGFDPHDSEWETGSGLRTVWSSEDDCDESCTGSDDCDCAVVQPESFVGVR